jgi:hypothetical protein
MVTSEKLAKISDQFGFTTTDLLHGGDTTSAWTPLARM